MTPAITGSARTATTAAGPPSQQRSRSLAPGVARGIGAAEDIQGARPPDGRIPTGARA